MAAPFVNKDDDFVYDEDDDDGETVKRRKKKKHKDAIQRFDEEEEMKRRIRKERKRRERERKLKLLKSQPQKGRPKESRSNYSDEDDELLNDPSDASINDMLVQGMDILEKSLDLWIEHSTLNIGMFKISQFEYNIFDDNGQRILFVMPAIGSTEILRGNDRPSNYTVHTYMGREVCDVTYEFPTCCKKELKLKVAVSDEPFGAVEEVRGDFHVTDANARKIMKMTRVEILKKKQSVHVNCNLYYYNNNDQVIGSFSRNGKKPEHFILGTEPRGFYYRTKQDPPPVPPLKVEHKIFIVCILIGLTLSYGQL